MLLCDSAQAVDGKLFVLGGGWNQILDVGTPVSMGLAIKVTVPWDRTNEPHRLIARLVDADGQEVRIGADDQLVKAEADFEVGRPPGLAPGTSLETVFAPTFMGLLLEPNAYVWELEIDGEVLARASFRVGPAPRRGDLGGQKDEHL
jgi:hypothetical protein